MINKKKVTSTQKVYCKMKQCDAIVIIYEDGSYEVICTEACDTCFWRRKVKFMSPS